MSKRVLRPASRALVGAREPSHPAPRTQASQCEFQRSLLDAINNASPDGILVVDGNGIIVSHNNRFVEIWRIPPQRLAGEQPGSAVGASDDPILATVLERVTDRDGFLARVQELYASPHLDDYSEIELKDGRTIERHSTMLRGQQGQYLGRVWFFRDITARKRIESDLLALARYDALTGIMNRRYFTERATEEFARSARAHETFAIAEFDIDHFKRINDRHGHATGDEVLKAVCAATRATIRQATPFGRIGGEEFAVLLTGFDVGGVSAFAERVRGAVAAARVLVQGEEVCCTISIGVATRRAEDVSMEDCLRRADNALYAAKRNGRNRVEVDS